MHHLQAVGTGNAAPAPKLRPGLFLEAAARASGRRSGVLAAMSSTTRSRPSDLTKQCVRCAANTSSWWPTPSRALHEGIRCKLRGCDLVQLHV